MISSAANVTDTFAVISFDPTDFFKIGSFYVFFFEFDKKKTGLCLPLPPSLSSPSISISISILT